MVSLCGLALSSLFVINNKSVVHADTANANQNNNAISWDSDLDKAQDVQNDSEQSQQPAVQKADSTDNNQQNADSVQDSRAEMSNVESGSVDRRVANQNTAVQSPKVSNVQDAEASTPIVINNPADDTVHVHYVDRNGNSINDKNVIDKMINTSQAGQGSYSVPTASDGAKYQLNNPDGKYTIVSNGSFNGTNLKGNTWHTDAVTKTEHHVGQMTKQLDYDTTTVVTPAYDTQQLPVAFVDSNNNIIGMVQNYSGKVGTSQKISLSLPTGYKLAANQTMPTSVTFKNDTSPLLIKIVASGEKAKVDNPENNLVHVKFVDQSTGKDIGGSYDMYTYNLSGNTGTYSVPAGYATQNNTYDVDSAVQLIRNDLFGANAQKWRRLNTIMSDDDVKKLDEMCTQIENKYRAMGYNVGDIALANNGGIAIKSSANHDPLDDVLTNTGKQTDLPDDYMVLTTFVSDPSDHKHTGTVAVDKITNISQDELKKIWNTAQSSDYGGDIMLTRATEPIGISDKGNIVSGNTVTVPVHKSNSESFIDNSGNAISANGNTVSVVLTKPQSVNPATDTRCQSQATRTIQINFPDGQVPKSYDGVVDKSGKLVQTVHFTRTATEDALTGNILQYGSWTSDNKDPNFIGFEARTLPKIPGFTLKISPVSA